MLQQLGVSVGDKVSKSASSIAIRGVAVEQEPGNTLNAFSFGHASLRRMTM
ncbi:MAG: hypothetical protein U0Y68_20245 [Blastocatellia bacterium]